MSTEWKWKSRLAKTPWISRARFRRNWKKEALAARLNGEVISLPVTPINEEGTLEIVGFEDEDGRRTLRHTASHVLAQAVKHLKPEAKLAIGPAIENGFYYDFDVDEPFTPEFLAAVEKEMQKIIKKNDRVERFELPRAEALELMKDEPYKQELINDLPEDATLSFYRAGRFHRPVRGPASAQHRQDQGREAHEHRRRVLARQREEQDAPAHLRHGVHRQGRAAGLSRTALRRPRSATTASWAVNWIRSTFGTRGPGFPFFYPKGMILRNTGGLLAPDSSRARL